MAENNSQPFTLAEYRSIAEHAGEVFFLWDLNSDSLSTYGNWFDLLGFIPRKDNLSQRLFTTKKIHPHDLLHIREYLDTVSFTKHNRANSTYYETIFMRIKNVYGRYIPCKAQLITRFSEQNLPSLIYGRLNQLSSIDEAQYEQKRAAETDTLTGTLNYATFIKHVEKYISTDKQQTAGTMLAVKLNFPDSFADSFNELADNAIIADCADTIIRIFQSADLIGRFDNATFFIFCRSLTDMTSIKKKTLLLQKALSHSFSDDCGNAYTIPAAIGIALYPDNSSCAALLTAALKGCDRAAAAPEIPLLQSPVTTATLPQPQPIKTAASFFGSIIEATYKLLASNDNTAGIINLLLGIIGRHFDLSRVFIYQQDEYGEYYRKTFEWCAAGIRPIGRDFSRLPVRESDYLYRKLSRGQLYSCADITELPVQQQQNFASVQVKAFLRSRFSQKNQNLGCIGFDDCCKTRQWTIAEQDYIRFVAEVILNALASHSNTQKIAALNKQLTDVLNFLPTPVYVIDGQKMTLLFANAAQTKQPLQDGQHCYERIYGQKEQCAHCPVKHQHCRKIDWQGRPALLINYQPPE